VTSTFQKVSGLPASVVSDSRKVANSAISDLRPSEAAWLSSKSAIYAPSRLRDDQFSISLLTLNRSQQQFLADATRTDGPALAVERAETTTNRANYASVLNRYLFALDNFDAQATKHGWPNGLQGSVHTLVSEDARLIEDARKTLTLYHNPTSFTPAEIRALHAKSISDGAAEAKADDRVRQLLGLVRSPLPDNLSP
jgi:hypothetical protein